MQIKNKRVPVRQVCVRARPPQRSALAAAGKRRQGVIADLQADAGEKLGAQELGGRFERNRRGSEADGKRPSRWRLKDFGACSAR